jgi:hypothetical protein
MVMRLVWLAILALFAWAVLVGILTALVGLARALSGLLA